MINNITILRPGGGKTTRLMIISAHTKETIVCRNNDVAKHIESGAKRLDLKIPTPISYKAFIDGKYQGKNIVGFLIDDADFLLEQLGRQIPITAITLRKELEN